jgi:hypothetical protein
LNIDYFKCIMAQQAQQTQQAQIAERISAILKPSFDDIKSQIKDQMSITSTELILKLDTIITRVDVLEKLISGDKRPLSKGGAKKSAKGAVDTPATPAESAGGNTTVTTVGQVKFHVNKLFYFREMFKKDATFREKFFIPVIQEAAEKDASISAKTGDQKLTAEATFCWNYLKTNDSKGLYLEIDKQYNEDKQAFDTLHKKPLVEAEAHTPVKS